MKFKPKQLDEVSQQAEDNVRKPSDLAQPVNSLRDIAGDAVNGWMKRNKSLVLRQTPVWAQSMAGILISLGGITILGGIIFKIDEVVTVQGQLKSLGGTVEVETPAGGKVAEIYFKDGEYVQKGQLLVKFDTREAIEEKLALKRLIQYEEEQLQNELKSLQSKLSSLSKTEKIINQKLKTKKLLSAEMRALLEIGAFQKMQYLQQLDEIYTLETQASELVEQRQRIEYESQAQQLESRKKIDQMNKQVKSAELQLQYQNVRAPISGTIFDPQVRAESVLGPGQTILSVVSTDGLYAEVFVPNKDIGFIKNGQSTKVRVDAFPFSRYGELNSKVKQISADALPPDPPLFNFYRFPVKLNLDRDYLQSREIKIPLKPGMAVTANLKLREKRVISLLSDMLVDQTDSIKSIRQQ